MLKVTVTFDREANRADQTVIIKSCSRLTPVTAIVARTMAAGKGANAWVSDGQVAYRVTKSGARKI